MRREEASLRRVLKVGQSSFLRQAIGPTTFLSEAWMLAGSGFTGYVRPIGCVCEVDEQDALRILLGVREDSQE